MAAIARRTATERLRDHLAFVRRREAAGDEPEYRAERYDFPMTRQERGIRLYSVAGVEETPDGYRVDHDPIETVPTLDSEATDGATERR